MKNRAALGILWLCAAILAGPGSVLGQTAPTAADLASKLAAAVQDGSSAVRLKMKVESSGGGAKEVLQVQIKARRSPARSEVVYQVLWPNERKGESFLIRQDRGAAPQGQSFTPPDQLTRLDRSRMTEPVFGGDLAYQDVIENFFLWDKQSLAGEETVDRVECVILESVPGSGDATPYGKVRSWIDPKKLVAMRVEKYDRSGRLARRIDTTQVIKDDSGRHIPAGMTVRKAGGATVTEIDGSNIRHDIDYTDGDFTTQALTNFKVPR